MTRDQLATKIERIYEAIGVGELGNMEHLTILCEAFCSATKAAGIGEAEVLRVVRMTLGHPNAVTRLQARTPQG